MKVARLACKHMCPIVSRWKGWVVFFPTRVVILDGPVRPLPGILTLFPHYSVVSRTMKLLAVFGVLLLASQAFGQNITEADVLNFALNLVSAPA